MNAAYVATVQLLLDIAPAVFQSTLFAMKGGTALNLFIQDLPRLSVDIDVVFLPRDLDREGALKAITDELMAAKGRIEAMGFAAEVRQNKSGEEAKMFITSSGFDVKVEVNFIFRGSVLAPVRRSLSPAAQSLFAANAEVLMLDVPELYGSKLVAAMDRQHPRDLFDVQWMFDSFGLPPEFVDCFVVYLAGHNRPVHEVLFPAAHPMAEIFASEFSGMTVRPASLEKLEATRVRLFDMLPKALTAAHHAFLLSLVRGEPDWGLMRFPHLQELPAIRWKLVNLAKLKKGNPARFALQHEELAARLITP